MPPRCVQKARDLKSKVLSDSFKIKRCHDLWSGLSEVSNLPPYDLQIICKDDISIKCHQVLMASSSRFLHNLLQSAGGRYHDGYFKPSELVTFFSPDVSSEALVTCLSLLYDGYAIVSKDPDLANKQMLELKNIWNNIFKIDVVKLNNRKYVGFGEPPSEAKSRDFGNGNGNALSLISLLSPTLDDNSYNIKKEAELNNEDCEDTNNSKLLPFEDCDGNNVASTPQTKIINDSKLVTPTNSLKSGQKASKTFISDINEIFRTPTPTSSSRKRKFSSVTESKEQNHERIKDGNLTSVPQKHVNQEKTSSAKELKVEKKELNSVKKVRTENSNVVYSVERVHICVICNGKKPDGKNDREAMNLSFSDLRKLKEHYSKHFYNEGKVFEFFPFEDRNKNPDGSIKDQFGAEFKYRCDKSSSENPDEACWKSRKPKCGYKELALHNATDHELFEEIIVNDERPELQNLLEQIQDSQYN